MKEVDARGLSCPEPLMLAAQALKDAKEPVRVVVNEAHQRNNIEKYAKKQGKKVTVTEQGAEYVLVIE